MSIGSSKVSETVFEDSNLFAIMQNRSPKQGPEVLHIVLDEATRQSIVGLFSQATNELIYCSDGSCKTAQKFHADYTAQPNLDEYIEIEDFYVPDTIREAIDNPLSIGTYKPDRDELPSIRALFVGETKDGEYSLSLQRFRTAQYLKASGIHLAYGSNTFVNDSSRIWSKIMKGVGLTVLPSVDAAFLNGSLCFNSLHFAKQIFDLTDYYLEAGKPEIEEFVSLDGLYVENPDLIVNGMNSWERRKIASIRSARIIEDHPLEELVNSALELRYELPTKNNQLIIPSDKIDRKRLFQFLDEDVYRGLLTGAIYETNSKKYA